MPSRLLHFLMASKGASERFDRFEMTLEPVLTSAEAREYVKDILEALAGIPARDRFALRVEISGDALEIGDLAKHVEVDEHIERFHEDGDGIELRVEIFKETVERHLSVYSPKALGAYLESTPLAETLAALSSRFHDRLVFECYSEAPGGGSETLSFINPGEAIPDAPGPSAWRQRALTLLQDNAFRNSDFGTLVPQDFVANQATGVASIDKFMARACAALSVMFLSNFSELSGDQLTYRINGYKLLSGIVPNIASLVDKTATFEKISNWAYGAEGSSDKIGLARNVITLCVQKIEETPTHPEIWDAIQSNYQIYLKENIATYLEVRNKLAELLAESTHKTHSLVEGLLDSIRNGVLIILTFVLTVVVVNGLKDTGVHVIFSAEYLAIAVASLVLSTFAIWASCRDAYSRFEQSAKSTTDLLKRMYAHVMIATEFDSQVEPTIEQNRLYMKSQANKYKKFWLVFALLVALSFLIGHQVFGTATIPPKPHDTQTGNEKQAEKTSGVAPRALDAPAQTLGAPRPKAASAERSAGDAAPTHNEHEVATKQRMGMRPRRHALPQRADVKPGPSS